MGADVSCLKRNPSMVITIPATPTSMQMHSTTSSYIAPTPSSVHDFEYAPSQPQHRPRAFIRLSALITRLTQKNANTYERKRRFGRDVAYRRVAVYDYGFAATELAAVTPGALAVDRAEFC